MVSGFQRRQVRIFRPYPDEIPWELLGDENREDTQYPANAQMRIAKLAGEIIGVYVIEPVNVLCYRVIDLVVARSFRGHGLGRWLLGHAVGLAESKGAREILVSPRASHRFFATVGFEEAGADMKLTLTPE